MNATRGKTGVMLILLLAFALCAAEMDAQEVAAYPVRTGEGEISPQNDTCDGAEEIPLSTVIVGTTINATGDGTSSCGRQDSKDVWYRFSSETAGRAVFWLESASEHDMSLSVYDGCDGTEIFCGKKTYSEVDLIVFLILPDVNYLVRIAAYDEQEVNFSLAFQMEYPIVIDSVETLQMIGKSPDYPLNGDYMIVQDIDASATAEWNEGAGFHPIGTLDAPFRGVIDGMGHTISGLVIHRPDESGVGLFGYVHRAEISAINIDGCSITGGNAVGALAGANGYFSIEEPYPAFPYGGIISKCFASGRVTGNQDVGGMVGNSIGGSMRACHATTSVSGDKYVGGLVGIHCGDMSAYGHIIQCCASGTVIGNTYTGGLIGLLIGGVYPSGPSECFATGSVTGTAYAGGLIGAVSGLGVYPSDCFATGAVSAVSHVGGLIASFATGTITNCYAAGSIFGLEHTGGLVGLSEGNAVGCFWDIETSGQALSAGGNGLSTNQMKDSLSYISAGWDFSSVWRLNGGNSYPCLLWNPADMIEDNIFHSADLNRDSAFDLKELLRVIQMYNVGQYRCADVGGMTEDGFVAGAGGHSTCKPHDSDYKPQDWIIDLSELLRLVQFYNSNGYTSLSGNEDGYTPKT